MTARLFPFHSPSSYSLNEKLRISHGAVWLLHCLNSVFEVMSWRDELRKESLRTSWLDKSHVSYEIFFSLSAFSFSWSLDSSIDQILFWIRAKRHAWQTLSESLSQVFLLLLTLDRSLLNCKRKEMHWVLRSKNTYEEWRNRSASIFHLECFFFSCSFWVRSFLLDLLVSALFTS